VINPLLAEYKQDFNAPLEQLTIAQVGALLAEQQAWSTASAGQVSGYIEGGKVTIQNSGSAISVPLTGVTGVGSVYGGIQSGWTSVGAGTSTHTSPTTWPAAPAAPVLSANPAGKTVTAGESVSFTASASGVPTPAVQWQVSTNGGVTFVNDTTDAGNTTGTLTVAGTTVAESGQEYRAVFANPTGTATSAVATLTVKAVASNAPVVSSLANYWLGPLKFVLINGKNFTNVQAVDFGTKPALFYTLSSSQIIALAPIGSGTVDITVKTTSGVSATSSADRFTY
jgi:hypothetical protein